jgi:electron transfer flavoprotein alpha subunit
MSILLIAEHDGHSPAESTRCAISAAQLWEKSVEVLVCGANSMDIATRTAQLNGISKILLADAPHLATPSLEDFSSVLMSIGTSFEVILAPHGCFFASVLAHYAAKRGLDVLQDILAIDPPNEYVRLRYAGVVTETVRNTAQQQVLTVRTSRFPPVCPGSAPCPIQTIPVPPPCTTSRRISLTSRGARTTLGNARTIVSGGRSLGQDFLPLLQPLATALGAQIGATRGAVDNKLVPRDWQIGQTGQSVEPALYVAIGISGAIQHQVGMRNSQVVVAINRDPGAPIFGIADYGLVGDMHEIVPRLAATLAAKTTAK